MDKRPVVTITVRHFILTSYDKSTPETPNTPEEVRRRQLIFNEYGKEKPK